MKRIPYINTIGKTAREIITVLTGDVAGKIMTVGAIFILAKYLSVENFGIYSYLISILSLIGVAINPFSLTYLRDHRFFRFQKYDISYIWLSAVCSIPLFLLLSRYVYYLPWQICFAFGVNMILLNSGKNYFNIYEKYRNFSVLYFLNEGIRFAVILFFVFYLKIQRVESLVFWSYSVAAIALVIFLIFRVNFKEISIRTSITNLKNIYGDSIYVMFYYAIIPIIAVIDMYFVKKYLNNYQLGLYAFALKLYAVSLIGLNPMLVVFRIKQIDIAREYKFAEYFKKNIRKAFLYASVLYIASLGGGITVTYVFFKEYQSSIWASVILITVSFFSYLFCPFNYLVAFRKYKWMFINSVIALLLNVIINYFYVPRYGIIAAAASTFAAVCFNNLAAFVQSIYFSKRYRQANDSIPSTSRGE